LPQINKVFARLREYWI